VDHQNIILGRDLVGHMMEWMKGIICEYTKSKSELDGYKLAKGA
jgi:hypothetical protein